VTFGAAAELLQKYSADLATATLPDFNLPPSGAGRSRPFAANTPQNVIPDIDKLVLPPRELRKFARFDRLVTWTNEKGIGIYAMGTNKPLGRNSGITQEPRGGVWLGSDLLVWTPQTIMLLRGDGGATGWEVTVRSLPAVEIAAGDVEMQPPGPGNGMQERVFVGGGAVIIDNQVVRIRNGRIWPAGAIVPGGAAPPRRAPGGGEQIEHVRPVGDRVLIATSTGRITAIELSTGEIAWQSRVSDAPLQQLVNSDDFVAVRFADTFGAQIVALETFTGQIIWRRGFAGDNAQLPINMVIAPDGTLLYTMPDRLCGVDLYEPAKGMKFGDRPTPDAAQVFTGAEGVDQLIVADGRVLALADNGQFVRVLSPDDGKEMPRMPPLTTGANNFNVQIRVVGPRIYIVNQKTVMGYSLDKPDDNWTGLLDPQMGPNIREAFIGKRHIVLLGQPAQIGAEPAAVATHFRLIAYARYLQANSTKEVGRIDHTPDITDPAGMEADQWQPVEGGFYYRSMDRQAHFLKGAGAGN
jgi:hypothetical protein